MNKTLLLIGYVWPEPNSSAAGVRMLQLIELFHRHAWQVVFASPAALSEHRYDLHGLGVKECQIQLNHASFDQFVSELNPQAVIFDRFMMEEQFGWRVAKACPDALRILNTEDLHSLRQARENRLKQRLKQPGFDLAELWQSDATTLYDLMATTENTQREVAAIARCDLTLMISGFESQLLQTAFQIPTGHLFTLPFLYNQPAAAPKKFEERQQMVFIGNFRHAPNWDAVLWLKTELWPKIRTRLPQAELHIYGAYPSQKVTDLHNPKQGFIVKGWAKDAMQVIGDARLLLAPLRFGAGIKGKLAEAMLCGTPSITTPIGAEAMQPEHKEWPGAVASTVESFVQQAVTLYENASDWQRASQSARQQGTEQYCRIDSGENLLRRIQALLENLPTHRKSYFTGLMLNHHHHKSTQYMGQWIEAKNRLKNSL
ncbi:glycosyltransferase [Thiomicrorhabdus cannonii]|uniref:glycosyltransferase n=1 Tax=Thiomicrorhabdus cannonii TaxID=2748011 RepID=UPI0015BFD4DD|nr:glycosyltransferase [Thiomicrorhabdus cannonii]